MKKAIKIFLLLAIICGGFTMYQFIGQTNRSHKELAVQTTTIKIDKRLPRRRATAEEVEAVRKQAQKERDETAAELRKEKREDMKLYLSFTGTVLSAFTTIILAIINRKKS